MIQLRIQLRASCAVISVGVALVAATVGLAADRESSPSRSVRFNRDVRPILSSKCFRCHGPDPKRREADLRLDVESDALAARDGTHAIVPGAPEKSEVWERITASDLADRMPPPESKLELDADEIETLRRWIAEGANWEGHWSFTTPRAPAVPNTSRPDWTRSPIDAFILARLEAEGLSPSPEADRETLIRRVTYDLTGLPPTIEEIDDFVTDDSPRAYERVVDRLLSTRGYAERMTLMWMDAARYGDTSVFHADGPRDMWPWRDWVIDAYASNMPFDRFTVEQIAGDLLPNPTIGQLTASGFHRNHGTTDEGGAIDEEYRVEYIVDRIKTTGMVWLGLTLECGQCHDHKYDPLSQREYYQLFAYFNQSTDKGMQTRNGNAQPLVSIPNTFDADLVERLDEKIAELDARLAGRAREATSAFETWLAEATAKRKDATLPGGALAHFELDEKKGKKVSDEVDSERVAEVRGKPKWADGKLAGAFRFDGGTYLDAGDIGDFERTDGFSYGAWIFAEAKSAGAPIARMQDGNAYRGWDLYFANGKVSCHIIHKWPDNAIKVTAKKAIELKKWHHIFVTYDGASQAAGVKIYVDGVNQEWDIEQNGLSETIRNKVPLYLGSRNPGARFKGLVDDVRIYPRKLEEAEVAALAGADVLAPLLAIPVESRTAAQNEKLRKHYLANHDEPYKTLSAEIAKRKARRAELTKPISTVMVMRDVEKPRMTYVLNRGSYDSPIKEKAVEPGTPAFLPPPPDGSPPNRLGLARWLTMPEHPLTARVTVNRYWQMLFGTGIVRSSEDFGSQGEWPSHPDLLDWLATDFVANGWNVKRTLRMLVTSSTYRQSARVSPELRARDPENRLLARGPRFRLQGEFIRDGALAVSGLLHDRVGGPGVKPYQPPGLWNEVSLLGNVRFKRDSGSKLYRKSMYIYWKRSAPMPSMQIFDTPTREKCVVRRQRTNTPLQALVTLNDPQFIEASRMLAERMMREGGETPESRVAFAYRLVTARRPEPDVSEILVESYNEELTAFRENVERATELLSVGEAARDTTLPAAEHAAWTLVASMILNMDEALMRG